MLTPSKGARLYITTTTSKEQAIDYSNRNKATGTTQRHRSSTVQEQWICIVSSAIGLEVLQHYHYLRQDYRLCR
jgi:hypothetical protein